MQTINCYIPLKLRLRGDMGEDDWQALEEMLVVKYSSALKRSIAELTRASTMPEHETIREPFAEQRMGSEGYLLTSFDDGKPTVIPVQPSASNTTSAGSTASYTLDALTTLIRSTFSASQGKPSGGIYYGAYVTLEGRSTPELFYITFDENGNEIFKSIVIWHRENEKQVATRLSPGMYTLVNRAFTKGLLTRGNGRAAILKNPENMTLTVDFIVPAGVGETLPQAPTHPYRFYPSVSILRVNEDTVIATGARVVYQAAVEIWGFDEHGVRYLLGVSLPYAFLHYKWSIYKVTQKGKQEHLERIFTTESNRSLLEYSWESAGTYEIRCEVRLTYQDASPDPVSDERRDSVMELNLKMALELAQLEKSEQTRQPNRDPIWFQSASELLAHYRGLLEQERKEKVPNEANIRVIEEIIGKLEKHLIGQTAAGPYPIHAIFTERRTSQTRPVTLFIGPTEEPETWRLVDLTYPAFYQAYEGKGDTPSLAVHAAFERLRKSVRNKYPPGLILAHIDWPGMKDRYGIEPHNFPMETESWQKTAYEWLSTGAQIVGAIGLVAAIVFPPSAVLTTVLIIGAAAGATVSAINIAERIRTDNFSWDRETFSDIANIAASIAFAGAAGARGMAGNITRGLAEGEQITLTATNTLSKLLRVERVFLYTSLASDLTNAVVLVWDVVVQIRDVDATFGDATLAQYKQIYGNAEGEQRWRNERYARILGVLARAAISGTLLVVSIRGSKETLKLANERQAFLRQVRIPGAERPISTRLGLEPGKPLAPFPQAEFEADRVGFLQKQRANVAKNLNLDPTAAELQALSPQIAWDINQSWGNMSRKQQELLRRVLRGIQDLPNIRGFIRQGNATLEELASFLASQPEFVIRGISSFDTAVRRFDEFKTLTTSIPNLETFHWDLANLEAHFKRHVLGEEGYLTNHPNEMWRWATKLGIREAYNLDRAAFERLLASNLPGDVALRGKILAEFQQVYGEYVRTVMTRSTIFSRSERGAELAGSDGDLVWFAATDGTISSGYLPDTTGDIVDILMKAIQSNQSVLQLFQQAK